MQSLSPPSSARGLALGWHQVGPSLVWGALVWGRPRRIPLLSVAGRFQDGHAGHPGECVGFPPSVPLDFLRFFTPVDESSSRRHSTALALAAREVIVLQSARTAPPTQRSATKLPPSAPTMTRCKPFADLTLEGAAPCRARPGYALGTPDTGRPWAPGGLSVLWPARCVLSLSHYRKARG